MSGPRTLAVALGAVAVFAAPVAAEEPVFSHGWAFDEQGGPALFAHVCAACHQPDAKGAIGAAAYPALAGDEKLQSSGYVLALVLEGLGGMPPFADLMTDAQIADVTNYVRSHFGNSYPDVVSAAEVATARAKPAPK